MYQIAICDDEQQELDKVEHMLRAFDRPSDGFAIKRYTDAKALLLEIKTNTYRPTIKGACVGGVRSVGVRLFGETDLRESAF